MHRFLQPWNGCPLDSSKHLHPPGTALSVLFAFSASGSRLSAFEKRCKRQCTVPALLPQLEFRYRQLRLRWTGLKHNQSKLCSCARLSLSLRSAPSKIGCAEAPTPRPSSNKFGTVFGSNGALDAVRHSQIGNCVSICLCAHLSLSLIASKIGCGSA